MSKNKQLEKIIKDIFWMARRYAHGRHTYAPSIVRDSYIKLKEFGIDIPKDNTILPPDGVEFGGFILRSDYLDDINN